MQSWASVCFSRWNQRIVESHLWILQRDVDCWTSWVPHVPCQYQARASCSWSNWNRGYCQYFWADPSSGAPSHLLLVLDWPFNRGRVGGKRQRWGNHIFALFACCERLELFFFLEFWLQTIQFVMFWAACSRVPFLQEQGRRSWIAESLALEVPGPSHLPTWPRRCHSPVKLEFGREYSLTADDQNISEP